jgi:UDP-glucose 4-epimerase
MKDDVLPRKILVTGGCGYIGSHTIIDLYNNGFDVVTIDNNIRSKVTALNLIEKIAGKKPIHYLIDLCDKNAVRKVFETEKIDGIIHFAALKSVPESVEKPLLYYSNNINSLVNLLELANEFNVADFVFSSSCSVYGNVKELPVTENTPMGEAESPYAHTKQIGEDIIKNFSAKSNVRFVVLRYFNPVGAHESGLIGEDTTDVITAVIPRITGTAAGKFSEFNVLGNDYPTRDGTCIRDYIHVMDIAEAHTKALQYLEKSGNEIQQPLVLNLGTGSGVTVLEAIQSFEKISGVKLNWKFAPRRAGDVVAIYANNEKAKSILNWSIKRSLDTMLQTAWTWECRDKK